MAEKVNQVGPKGPVCCGEQTQRIRFYDSAASCDKANENPDYKKFSHVAYHCNHCGKTRTAETEEDAVARFRQS